MLEDMEATKQNEGEDSMEIKLTFAVATGGDLASWKADRSASVGPLNNEQIELVEQLIELDQEREEILDEVYHGDNEYKTSFDHPRYDDVTQARYELLNEGREIGLIKSKFFGRSRWTLITVDAGNGFANVDYPYQNLVGLHSFEE